MSLAPRLGVYLTPALREACGLQRKATLRQIGKTEAWGEKTVCVPKITLGGWGKFMQRTPHASGLLQAVDKRNLGIFFFLSVNYEPQGKRCDGPGESFDKGL